MENFKSEPMGFFTERHRAKKTWNMVFCFGWAILLACAYLFFSSRPPQLAEAIVCWCVLGLVMVYLIGIAVEAALSFVITRLHYQVGADKRNVSVLWRDGKGNLAFPRKALRRVAYQTDQKTGEGYLAFCLRKELLGQIAPEANKFFDKFRKRYNCDYALTARQIGSSEHFKKLAEYLLRGPARVRLENMDKIMPPVPKRLPTWLLGVCGGLYLFTFYLIWFLNHVPALPVK